MVKLKDRDDSASKLSTKQIVSWFIASSYTTGGFSTERVNNSISLLKKVPAARNAVLQRFTHLFEEATRHCLEQCSIEFSNSGAYALGQELNSSIQIVVNTLNDLLEKNRQAWGPILCEWSVESLGLIGGCFKKGMVLGGSSSHPNNQLNETVAFWMQAYPARMLLNLYRSCVKLLIDRRDATCLDSLLATSAKHAPNFDWVVADIGNSFPSEIINRVLKSGFKEFAAQQWEDDAIDNDQSKIKSVVRILEHLSNRHSQRVQKAMIDLYKSSSLSDDTGQVKVLLYIMHLLSDSPLLIAITTKPFMEVLDDSNISSLFTQFQKLPDHGIKIDSVCSLAVHLICQSSAGSFLLIQLIIRFSSADEEKPLKKQVRGIFSELLVLLLQDMLQLAMRRRVVGEKKENGVISELKMHHSELCDMFLETKSVVRRNCILTLMKIVSIRGYACPVINKLICGISDIEELVAVLDLYAFVSPVIPGFLEQILEYSFARVSSGQMNLVEINNLIKNLWQLLSGNVDSPVSYELQNKLQKRLWNYVKDFLLLITALDMNEVANSLSVDIIAVLLSSPIALAPEASHYSLSVALVCHFFKLLHCGKVNNDPSMVNCRRALVQLSQVPDSFTIVCQFALESSVTQANAILFGRHAEEAKEDQDGAPKLSHLCSEQRASLLSQHRAHVASTSVVGYAPILVETGIVGNGPKRKKSCPLSKSTQATNNECISLLLHRCCCKTGSGGSFEGGVVHDTRASYDEEKLMILGARLFEAVTSSTPGSLLHAETKWPEPQFRKYTIERDLYILAFFDEHPFVWSIMDLLANSPKALWRCSLLLRAVSGALLHHWESSREKTTSSSERDLAHSIMVIKVLEKGQLLPEPLCFIGELFTQLSPYEVFLVMSDVWKFIHEHPLPENPVFNSSKRRQFQEEGAPLQPYLITIHSILHANIGRMGHLYARFVPSSGN